MSDTQAIVIGGGIAGCLTACQLADAGVRVLLVEQDASLMNGASRWNDGKIHLGYTFNGTPSLVTASLLIRGSGVFFPTVERALGSALPEAAVGQPVMYLVDRGTMVPREALWERAQATHDLTRRAMDALPGLCAYPGLPNGRLERVEPARAEELTGLEGVVAAWRTPEVHVAPRVVADALARAVTGRSVPVLHERVTWVGSHHEGWAVRTSSGDTISAPVVVNCSWEGRPTLDRQVAASDEPISIRYKYALFGRGVHALADVAPSTRILGRYGDVVRHPNGDAYLSWYPAGLVARSHDGSPPDLPPLDPEAMIKRTLAGLGISESILDEQGATWDVRGGYVVAHGHGDIDHVGSPLHHRDRPAVTELRPGYLTVDTGKYTLGPMMALRASAMAARHLGVAPAS